MNIIDTRDLYKRQCELQEELESLQDAVSDAQEEYEAEYGPGAQGFSHEHQEAEKALSDWQSEYQEELDELNDLESEVGDNFMHGETLIDEDDFVEYVQDLAEDMGATAGDDHSWLVIDWEATADNVKMDYSSCEYQGTTYLFRS